MEFFTAIISAISIIKLVQLSYLCSLCYMLSNWLAKKSLLNLQFANLIRLISVLISGIVITLMLTNHISQYAALFLKDITAFASITMVACLPLVFLFLLIYHERSCAYVLGTTIMMVPLYAFLVLMEVDSTL